MSFYVFVCLTAVPGRRLFTGCSSHLIRNVNSCTFQAYKRERNKTSPWIFFKNLILFAFGGQLHYEVLRFVSFRPLKLFDVRIWRCFCMQKITTLPIHGSSLTSKVLSCIILQASNNAESIEKRKWSRDRTHAHTKKWDFFQTYYD